LHKVGNRSHDGLSAPRRSQICAALHKPTTLVEAVPTVCWIAHPETVFGLKIEAIGVRATRSGDSLQTALRTVRDGPERLRHAV
jgi:hypothetical protein